MTDLVGAAFVAGLTGGLHCIGMCGPFAAASGPAWHIGRFLAYAAFGALAGLGGAALPQGWWVSAVAAVFLVWSSLKFGGFLRPSEASGLTTFLIDASRRMRGLPAWAAPVGMGLLAALLPCGLFWSALGLATASRSAVGGATVLLAFGIGTLPALFAAGAVLARLAQRARRAVALGVMVLGLFALAHRAGLAPEGGGEVMGDAPAQTEAP